MKKIVIPAVIAVLVMSACGAQDAAPTPTTTVTAASEVTTPGPLVSASPVVGSHAASLSQLVSALEQTGIKCPAGWYDGGNSGSTACADPVVQVFVDPLAPGDMSLMESTKDLYHQAFKSKGGVVAGDNWVVGADSDLVLALVTLNVGGEVV